MLLNTSKVNLFIYIAYRYSWIFLIYFSNLIKGNYVIGFQFRSGFFEVDVRNINISKEFEIFQQCALSIEQSLLGEPLNAEDGSNSTESGNSTKKVMWFISTDNPEVQYFLQRRHGDKIFWVFNDVGGWGRTIVDK